MGNWKKWQMFLRHSSCTLQNHNSLYDRPYSQNLNGSWGWPRLQSIGLCSTNVHDACLVSSQGFILFAATLFEIFKILSKIQLWFPEKIVDFFGWKTREIVLVLGFLAVNNFDFTRKIVKKNLGEKLVKMLGFIKIEFLDKNLTFRMFQSKPFVSMQLRLPPYWLPFSAEEVKVSSSMIFVKKRKNKVVAKDEI